MRIYNVEPMPTTDPMILPICDTPLDLDLAQHIGIRVYDDGSIQVPCTGPTTISDIIGQEHDETQKAYVILVPGKNGTHYRLSIRSNHTEQPEYSFLPNFDDDEADALHMVIAHWLVQKVIRYQKRYGVLQDFQPPKK